MHEQGEAEPPPPASTRAEHQVTLTERGPFIAPRCICGWYGPARRSRPLARTEAAAHLAGTVA
ncbi:hypothetical protein [Streptomyces sp. NBC_01803]|uniref:hypothetical protein n=1 Tax=Streptomyces sp. NBC_01803 TaxID=2975946 RepID=UPI002DDA955C|nr:hypothetical protein [Streptomyces sp. NBC_01803]WSA44890.1 hypothetical protein OIE51_12140 [Streptomyces sp. NBC_01803]